MHSLPNNEAEAEVKAEDEVDAKAEESEEAEADAYLERPRETPCLQRRHHCH